MSEKIIIKDKGENLIPLGYIVEHDEMDRKVLSVCTRGYIIQSFSVFLMDDVAVGDVYFTFEDDWCGLSYLGVPLINKLQTRDDAARDLIEVYRRLMD